MIEAIQGSLGLLFDPMHIFALVAGVLAGLFLGAVPGLGGVSGLAMLLPFTFNMDASLAISAMIGLISVVSTGDTIPAVLFGVPGTAAAQATIMDGYPLAKKGEADRALAVAFISSILGGLFGTLVLGLSLPAVRPIVLAFGSPENFMVGIWGIAMVAVLSTGSAVRGLVSALIGLLLASIGPAPQASHPRWTLDMLYMYDGLPLVPLTLGIFAMPEMIELYIKGTRVAEGVSLSVRPLGTVVRGALRDVFRHWFLVLRSGLLGAWVGIIPGVGSSVVDWLAYGHALGTEKGARETFGKGDIRGVIAPESANNSIHGGALVPTLAFGIPGSLTMALFMGALLYHNIQPGLSMLTRNLDLTLLMLWSLPVANLLGGILCLLLTKQFMRLTILPSHLLIPGVFVVVAFAAFQSSQGVGDLWSLFLFTLLGWLMKSNAWPRPPLILAFILGPLIENYLIISIDRYEWTWLYRPIVVALLLLTVASVAYGLRSSGKPRAEGDAG